MLKPNKLNQRNRLTKLVGAIITAFALIQKSKEIIKKHCPEGCNSCIKDSILNPDSRKCIECLPGYSQKGKICERCKDPNCFDCFKNVNMCVDCNPGFFKKYYRRRMTRLEEGFKSNIFSGGRSLQSGADGAIGIAQSKLSGGGGALLNWRLRRTQEEVSPTKDLKEGGGVHEDEKVVSCAKCADHCSTCESTVLCKSCELFYYHTEDGDGCVSSFFPFVEVFVLGIVCGFVLSFSGVFFCLFINPVCTRKWLSKGEKCDSSARSILSGRKEKSGGEKKGKKGGGLRHLRSTLDRKEPSSAMRELQLREVQRISEDEKENMSEEEEEEEQPKEEQLEISVPPVPQHEEEDHSARKEKALTKSPKFRSQKEILEKRKVKEDVIDRDQDLQQKRGVLRKEPVQKASLGGGGLKAVNSKRSVMTPQFKADEAINKLTKRMKKSKKPLKKEEKIFESQMDLKVIKSPPREQKQGEVAKSPKEGEMRKEEGKEFASSQSIADDEKLDEANSPVSNSGEMAPGPALSFGQGGGRPATFKIQKRGKKKKKPKKREKQKIEQKKGQGPQTSKEIAQEEQN